MKLDLLSRAVRLACAHETSADPNGWTLENPLWGHCVVVALVVQDHCGGQLLRSTLEGTSFAHLRSHYWNRLPDGIEADLTREQFGAICPVLSPGPGHREYVLTFPHTRDRYERFQEVLKLRLKELRG